MACSPGPVCSWWMGWRTVGLGLKWHPDRSWHEWDTHQWCACFSGKDVPLVRSLAGKPESNQVVAMLGLSCTSPCSLNADRLNKVSHQGDNAVLDSLLHVLPLSTSSARHMPDHSTGPLSKRIATRNSPLKTLLKPWPHCYWARAYGVMVSNMYVSLSTRSRVGTNGSIRCMLLWSRSIIYWSSNRESMHMSFTQDMQYFMPGLEVTWILGAVKDELECHLVPTAMAVHILKDLPDVFAVSGEQRPGAFNTTTRGQWRLPQWGHSPILWPESLPTLGIFNQRLGKMLCEHL